MNILASVALSLVIACVPICHLDCDTAEEVPVAYTWEGEKLNAVNGVVQGPSGKETYYNLPMEGVLEIMRGAGFTEDVYPYWIREDGVKMLGPYVICACDQTIRPLGTIVDTTLGQGIVCDTGNLEPYQVDIAVSW